MKYIDLINSFWKTDAAHAHSSTDTRLYFLLLKHANSSGLFSSNDCDSFTISNRRLSADCEISERVLIDAKRRLKQRGLIDFQCSNVRGDITKYFIIDLLSFFVRY